MIPLTTIMRWTAPRVPITDDLREGWIKERLLRGSYDAQTSAGFRRTADELPYPDSARAYERLRVGSDGLLWVQLFVSPGAPSTGTNSRSTTWCSMGSLKRRSDEFAGSHSQGNA